MTTTAETVVNDVMALLKKVDTEVKGAESATETKPVIKFVSGGDAISKSIPPTPWLVGTRIVRGFVNVVLAPGGIGKSTLTIADALSVAAGKKLIGDKVWVQGCAWILNLEDGVDEQRRRLLAAARHHKLEDPKILDRVMLTSGPDHCQVVLVAGKDPVMIAPMIDEVVRIIEENKIIMVVADPFVRSHRVDENNNMAIDLVLQAWDTIAKRTGAAVVLVHHSKKANGEDQNGNMDMARGASSFMSAARSAITLGRMTKAEGTKFGFAEGDHVNYLRMDNAKSNMAAPSKDARWFRLVSVHLNNGDETYRDGDTRATLEAVTLTMGIEKPTNITIDPTDARATALEYVAAGPILSTAFQSQLQEQYGIGENKARDVMNGLIAEKVLCRKKLGKAGYNHSWVGTPEQIRAQSQLHGREVDP